MGRSKASSPGTSCKSQVSVSWKIQQIPTPGVRGEIHLLGQREKGKRAGLECSWSAMSGSCLWRLGGGGSGWNTGNVAKSGWEWGKKAFLGAAACGGGAVGRKEWVGSAWSQHRTSFPGIFPITEWIFPSTEHHSQSYSHHKMDISHHRTSFPAHKPGREVEGADHLSGRAGCQSVQISAFLSGVSPLPLLPIPIFILGGGFAALQEDHQWQHQWQCQQLQRVQLAVEVLVPVSLQISFQIILCLSLPLSLRVKEIQVQP